MAQSKSESRLLVPDYYVGCISGTSIDGLDLALSSFDDIGGVNLVVGYTVPIPMQLRQQLLDLTQPGEDEIRRMGAAHVAFGYFVAKQIMSLVSSANLTPFAIRAIGSHGQTVRHYPEADYPFTLQLGEPNIIAEMTGIDTIADFRNRDIAAGGQGAPLASGFHQFLLQTQDDTNVLLNIGGMSNVTLVMANGNVLGFDTGPGNVLIDYWCQKHFDQPMDKDGVLARQGSYDKNLVNILLSAEYFRRAPPKSTGREEFNGEWLEAKLATLDTEPELHDVLASLVRVTAQSIADGLSLMATKIQNIWVCGGGRLNKTLMQNLAEVCPARVVEVEDMGVDGDLLEALAFAWLARQWKRQKMGNIPDVTGATGPRILGGLYLGKHL